MTDQGVRAGDVHKRQDGTPCPYVAVNGFCNKCGWPQAVNEPEPWWETKYPTEVYERMLERIGPRSPGMGNPPAFLWEIATPEGVAHVLAIAAINALRALPVEDRMEAMGMVRLRHEPAPLGGSMPVFGPRITDG